MSIFKTKFWWSNENLREENNIDGLQSDNTIKVDKFNSFIESDCVMIGEGRSLKIYKPSNTGHQSTHIIIEKEFDNIILQIDTGKFIINCEDQQIIILQPLSYSVYTLEKTDGHSDGGEQNVLVPVLNHKFNNKAHSFVSGHFGNAKSRDLVCVQSLNGSLNFFDQDSVLFVCHFNDIVIPGPISYVSNCDSFVICKSTWILEIFSFHQLRDYSDQSIRTNKKIIPEWFYNAGEEISAVQIVQTSNNFSSILALGERYMYCFQDNGLMKFMKKFDFMPMCFHAYIVGWYYEPGSRLIVMVASEDSKLYIYENTSLLWSCELLQTPVVIARCFLKGLPGGLVSLSTNGVVTVSYVGTEPDLNNFSQAILNESTDDETVQLDLDEAEKTLQKIIDNNPETTSEAKSNANYNFTDEEDKLLEDIINISIDIGRPVQNLFDQSDRFEDATLHLLISPVITKLTFENPSVVQSLQISYVCYPPFTISDAIICLDSVNGTEIIETNIFLSSEMDIVNTYLEVLFTVTNDKGKIIVIRKTVPIPLNIFCILAENSEEYTGKLIIKTNNACVNLIELFSEFSKEMLLENENTSTNITIKLRASKKTLCIEASQQEYTILSHDIKDIIPILESLVYKLYNYFKSNGNIFEFHIPVDKDLSNQLTHRFLKSIDNHAKVRIKLKNFEDQLMVLQRQFVIVQKKLLLQYGSLPPGDCDPLEFLMQDTFDRLQNITHDIIQCRESVRSAGNSLVAVGNLIIYILRLTTVDKLKVKLVEEMLTLHSLYEDYQEWEEAVSQSISYILNNIFTKSEKVKEKLAPVTEQGILANINLKRFLKQLKFILDKMFAEPLTTAGDDNTSSGARPKVVRVEEFVEVI